MFQNIFVVQICVKSLGNRVKIASQIHCIPAVSMPNKNRLYFTYFPRILRTIASRALLHFLFLTMSVKFDHTISNLQNWRSSHRRCSIKKDIIKDFAKFTGKHLRWSIFFNKVESLKPETLLKRDSNPGAFLWILRLCLPKHFLFFRTTPGDCFWIVTLRYVKVLLSLSMLS